MSKEKDPKKKKRKGGGGKKGRPFEKEIAKELSLWWTDGGQDDVFYCTAGSGSRFTSRKKQGKDTSFSCGDIGLTDPVGKRFLEEVSVEIKRGYSKSLDLLSFVDSKNKNHMLLDWIDKANKEVKEANRTGFLIVFRRDRKEKTICLRKKYLKQLDKKFRPEREIIIGNKGKKYSIISYTEFFNHFTPKNFTK